MIISVITPTADRPLGIAWLTGYLKRQTVQPDYWLLVDDGERHAPTPDNSYHWKRIRDHDGPRSLAANILGACDALEHSRTDVVVICEDDDWYAPDHIKVCLRHLDQPDVLACGSIHQRYYNIRSRQYRTMINVGSALCNTALRIEALPFLRRAATVAYEKDKRGVDRLFWESIRGHWAVHETNTVVGIKGIPGRAGLGIGHRPDTNWTDDPDGRVLIDWIGEDADRYLDHHRIG